MDVQFFQCSGPYIPVSFLALLPVGDVVAWMRERQAEGFILDAAERNDPAWKRIADELRTPVEFLIEKSQCVVASMGGATSSTGENRQHAC